MIHYSLALGMLTMLGLIGLFMACKIMPSFKSKYLKSSNKHYGEVGEITINCNVDTSKAMENLAKLKEIVEQTKEAITSLNELPDIEPAPAIPQPQPLHSNAQLKIMTIAWSCEGRRNQFTIAFPDKIDWDALMRKLMDSYRKAF